MSSSSNVDDNNSEFARGLMHALKFDILTSILIIFIFILSAPTHMKW